MKQRYDLVVVIPVGPPSKLEWVIDTIKSVQFYIGNRKKIIVIDNSQKGLGRNIYAACPDVDIITTKRDHGKMGGLYVNLSNAFRYAYEQYDFDLLLRMDDDALVIGRDPHVAAQDFLSRHPDVGMVGRYIKGQLSSDMYGNIHDNYWPRKQILKDACTWKFIRRPIANLTLRKLAFKAFRNGYELGENIQGGAYFISRLCIQRMIEHGYMPVREFKNVVLCEDHLFSMITKLVGMNLADFAGPGQPFGVAWQGLPASPERLYNDNKKIIHSVRYWKEMQEDDIRRYFLQCRITEGATSTVVGAH